MENKRLIDEKTEALIRKILAKGHDVELKRIGGRLTVVEIERRKQAQTDM